MKTKIIPFAFFALGALLLQGCVAFPPLVSVEHKESPANNQEILRRLDAIDHRLGQLEQKGEKSP
jgi:hypothetical protein